jgi:hypothetical protein
MCKIFYKNFILILKFHFFSAVVGEVDETIDKQLDLEKLKAAPLQPIWLP